MTKTETLYKLHEELSKAALEVLKEKHHDYTNASEDPLKCLRQVEAVTGVDAVSMLLARMTECLARIKTFSNQGHLKVAEHSLDNSIGDLLNWSVLLAYKLKFSQDFICHTHISSPGVKID